jgi:hypothetical protein
VLVDRYGRGAGPQMLASSSPRLASNPSISLQTAGERHIYLNQSEASNLFYTNLQVIDHQLTYDVDLCCIWVNRGISCSSAHEFHKTSSHG